LDEIGNLQLRGTLLGSGTRSSALGVEVLRLQIRVLTTHYYH